MNAQKKCSFCNADMILAWAGKAPMGYYFEAWICPECYRRIKATKLAKSRGIPVKPEEA